MGVAKEKSGRTETCDSASREVDCRSWWVLRMGLLMLLLLLVGAVVTGGGEINGGDADLGGGG